MWTQRVILQTKSTLWTLRNDFLHTDDHNHSALRYKTVCNTEPRIWIFEYKSIVSVRPKLLLFHVEQKPLMRMMLGDIDGI